MPAPAAIAPLAGPPFTPARLPSSAFSGGIGGEVYAEIVGVVLALDDAWNEPNPTWTRLDEPGGALSVQEWTVDRGRRYELDKTATGTATIRVKDLHGLLDPTNTASPYFGKLNPRKQAAIALFDPVAAAWSTVFRGFISDLKPSVYVTETVTEYEFELVDGFDVLAATEVVPDSAGNAVAAESAGDVFYDGANVDDRIRAALADADWPATLTEIFSGNVSVRGTVYAPRSAILSVIQDAADAEWPIVANVFMTKTGRVAFRGRLARFLPADYPAFISFWSLGDVTAAAGGTTAVIAGDLAFNRDKANIYNAALATPQGIADADIAGQLASDATSIAAYGVSSISFENLLTLTGLGTGNDALTETRLFAQFIVDHYKDPRNRVDSVGLVTQPPGSLYGPAWWAFVCGVEIGDVVTLTTTHPGSGGFSEDFFVEGVHYQAHPMNDTHLEVHVQLDLSPRNYYGTTPF